MRQTEHHEHRAQPHHGRHVELVLVGLRDPRNVGQAFRTAEALGVAHLHLCDATPAPPSAKVARTARGAQHFVPWGGGAAGEVIDGARARGLYVVALELATASLDLRAALARRPGPLALVVGHEAAGLSAELLAACDVVAHVPLYGRVSSLNVATALALGLWEAVRAGGRDGDQEL